MLANDTDADGDPFTIIDRRAPSAGGHRDVHAHRRARTRPATGFDGTETFTYTVDDDDQRSGHGDRDGHGDGAEPGADRDASAEPREGVAPHLVTAIVGGSDPDAIRRARRHARLGRRQPCRWPWPCPVGRRADPHLLDRGNLRRPSRRLRRRGERCRDRGRARRRRRAARRPPPATTRSSPSATTVRLDATGSRPTVGIGSYRWVIRTPTGTTVAIRNGSLVEWTPDCRRHVRRRASRLTLGARGRTCDTATITVVDPVVEPGLPSPSAAAATSSQGADVLALDADGVRFAGVTGADGTTRLLGLPDGDVTVYAFAPGFVPASPGPPSPTAAAPLIVDARRRPGRPDRRWSRVA